MSKARKMFVSRVSISSPENVSSEKKKKVKDAISTITFSDIKFERVIEKDEKVKDSYRVTAGSKVLSKDGRYLSGFLLKESSLKTGKINETTEIKDKERSNNDEGVRFTIDLSEMLVVYYTVQHFKTDQFNKALTFILNQGIHNLGVQDVQLKVDPIKDNLSIPNIIEELKKIGKIKELSIEVDFNENSKDYKVNLTPDTTNQKNIYRSKYATGLNLNNIIIEKLREVISLHLEIEKINEEEKIDIGIVKISGKTILGKTFGTGNTEKITYDIDDKYCDIILFIDKSKDILEEYIKSVNL